MESPIKNRPEKKKQLKDKTCTTNFFSPVIKGVNAYPPMSENEETILFINTL